MPGTQKSGLAKSPVKEVKYFVEKLVCKRILKSGKEEFKVKWMGYSSRFNSFEPRDQLMEDVPNLVIEYEKSMEQKNAGSQSEQCVSTQDDSQQQATAHAQSDGNDRRGEIHHSGDKITVDGCEIQNSEANVLVDKSFIQINKPVLIPECILGMTQDSVTDELQFLIKWKDMNEASLVPAKRANIACPQLVIKWYEKHLIWSKDTQVDFDDGSPQIVDEHNERFYRDFDWEIVQ